MRKYNLENFITNKKFESLKFENLYIEAQNLKILYLISVYSIKLNFGKLYLKMLHL